MRGCFWRRGWRCMVFSGFIFNHGSWFAPGGGSKPIEWTVDATALPQWPEPDVLARKVVAGAERGREGQGRRGRDTGCPRPRKGRPKLQGDVSLEGQDEAGGSVRLSLTGKSARARRFIRRPGLRKSRSSWKQTTRSF